MTATTTVTPVVQGVNLVKTFGRVVALDGMSLELYPGEVLAVVGDNGAGKSTLIKCFSGRAHPRRRRDVRQAASRWSSRAPTRLVVTASRRCSRPSRSLLRSTSPATSTSAERSASPASSGTVFRTLDKKRMRTESSAHLKNLGISTLQNITQAVETLSGGQRQAVAVARAAAFGSQVIILDEPTAALGVNESARVLKMIQDLRDRGLSVILISHNMPQVFEVADRIHVARLGKRAAVMTPQTASMNDVVAIMTGAMTVPEEEQQLTPVR